MRGPATGSPPLFVRLLDRLEREGVPCAVLRDRDPADPALDELDLLVWPAHRARFGRVAREAGFVRARRHLPLKDVFAAYAGGRLRLVDVHYALVQGGLVYMDLPDPSSLGRDPFPRLDPRDELRHLLCHSLLGKGGIQEKHLGRVRELASRVGVPDGFPPPERCAQGTAEAADAAARLRRALRRRPLNLVRDLYVRHLMDRVRRPRGTLVAFLGVDGAGKTTTVELLTRKLEETGRVRFARAYMGPWGQFRTRALAWAYARGFSPPEEDWLRLFARGGGLRCLSKWARGKVRGLVYYAAVCWDLWQRYLRDARPRLRRGEIVLADRYVYDLRHLHHGRPIAVFPLVRRLICALFPRPDLLFFLCNAPEEIVARKPQLTVADARAQQETYRRALAGRGAVEVTTSRPPEEIAEELAARILARHHERR